MKYMGSKRGLIPYYMITFLFNNELFCQLLNMGKSCDVVAKVLDCDIVVSDFELKICYFVYFRANTIGKAMNPLIPLFMS